MQTILLCVTANGDESDDDNDNNEDNGTFYQYPNILPFVTTDSQTKWDKLLHNLMNIILCFKNL